MNESLHAHLQTLLDREAIRELARRYCHYVWQKDVRVVDLFAEDGAFGEHHGREALLDFYGALFATPDAHTYPYVHNHVVEFVSEDRASGTCYNDLRTVRDGQRHAGSGYWEDEYTRTAAGWRFQSRRFTLVLRVRLPDDDE